MTHVPTHFVIHRYYSKCFAFPRRASCCLLGTMQRRGTSTTSALWDSVRRPLHTSAVPLASHIGVMVLQTTTVRLSSSPSERQTTPHVVPLRSSSGSDLQQGTELHQEEEDVDISSFLLHPSTPSTSSVSHTHSEEEDSVDVAERKRRTKLFLLQVLHTPDEQLWKDLVVSALRHHTLQSHHLEQLLQGVTAVVAENQQTNSEDLATRPKMKSHSARLQRVVQVLQFVHDQQREFPESFLYPTSDATGEASKTEKDFLLSGRLTVRLLVMLLQAAQQHLESLQLSATSSPQLGEGKGYLYFYTYRGVWEFLAWLERSELHIGSEKVIEALKETVELDLEEQSLAQRSHHRAAGVTAAAVGAAQKMVLLQRQTNRLSYLWQEELWAKERRQVKGEGLPAHQSSRWKWDGPAPRRAPAPSKESS